MREEASELYRRLQQKCQVMRFGTQQLPLWQGDGAIAVDGTPAFNERESLENFAKQTGKPLYYVVREAGVGLRLWFRDTAGDLQTTLVSTLNEVPRILKPAF